MKKKSVGFALVMIAVFFIANPVMASMSTADPSYSMIDGVFFSDPSVECDELKNSEECEIFKSRESYSTRDGLAYGDCSIECDNLFESDACYSYRATYPCPLSEDSVVASVD